MKMFETFVLIAQAAAPDTPPAPNMLMSFLPLIFIFVIFYFLLIRPQQKRQKAHQKLVSALKTGDKVVTSAGIHGLVTNVKERTVILKVSDNVKIEFDRASVASVVQPSDSSSGE
ncbi:MAG: preprotein translocase subunit YajC [Chthoniobacterales bacterium]